MKARLLFPDRAFDLHKDLPLDEAALTRDLDLGSVLAAMADGDAFLFEVARRGLFESLTDTDTILYRQDAFRDCLRNPAVIDQLYRIAEEAIAQEDRQLRFRPDYAVGLMNRSRTVIGIFLNMLGDLARIAHDHAGSFESQAFTSLLAAIVAELDDTFFRTAASRLEGLKIDGSLLLSASLGSGNKGVGYVLRAAGDEKEQSWLRRLFAQESDANVIAIADRDEAGARSLSALRDRTLGLLAAILARSADRILGFFTELRTELAFYRACLNLHRRLSLKGEAICFPLPFPPGERSMAFHGLYDISTCLNLDTKMVANDFEAADARLVVITGANRGGKSAFLRSIGLSQLMMQAGMFVAADSFSAGLRGGVHTHFRREEDAGMKSGKFDEELQRMSGIIDRLKPDSLLLFNESFAATNEREGSEIAGQIVRALLAGGMQIFFVTHLYEFARALHDEQDRTFSFLTAERRADGARTYRMIPGAPSGASFGRDLYDKVFGSAP